MLCPISCVQSFQLQLQAPSGDTVPAQGGLPVTQLLRILNPKKVSSGAPTPPPVDKALGLKSQILTLVSTLIFLGPLEAEAAPHLQPLWPVCAGDL